MLITKKNSYHDRRINYTECLLGVEVEVKGVSKPSKII